MSNKKLNSPHRCDCLDLCAKCYEDRTNGGLSTTNRGWTLSVTVWRKNVHAVCSLLQFSIVSNIGVWSDSFLNCCNQWMNVIIAIDSYTITNFGNKKLNDFVINTVTAPAPFYTSFNLLVMQWSNLHTVLKTLFLSTVQSDVKH